MLHKTQGVVLGSINYNDKYLLVQIYTQTLGRVTYMVAKTQSKTKKVAKSLFSPLAILDLEVDHQANRDIQRIQEARSAYPLFSIPSDMAKSAIAFFLSEFLTRTLKDIDPNEQLFNYLNYSIRILEDTTDSVANFHLAFVFRLSYFLGFYPNLEEYESGAYFDLLNGVFVKKQPLHNHYILQNESIVLSRLARISYENMHRFLFSRQDRITIIERMIEYYRIHLHDFQNLKSLEVLHELF